VEGGEEAVVGGGRVFGGGNGGMRCCFGLRTDSQAFLLRSIRA
jgi:hypothetical protein